MNIDTPLYFAWQVGIRHSRTLFKYEKKAAKVARITDKRLNFCNIYTVQIKTDVYGFRHNTDPSLFTKFSELYSNDIKTTVLANSPTARGYPSLFPFKN